MNPYSNPIKINCSNVTDILKFSIELKLEIIPELIFPYKNQIFRFSIFNMNICNMIFKIPFNMIISGSSQSEKTTKLVKLLKYIDIMLEAKTKSLPFLQ